MTSYRPGIMEPNQTRWARKTQKRGKNTTQNARNHGREPRHTAPPSTSAYDPPPTETATACTTGAANATGDGGASAAPTPASPEKFTPSLHGITFIKRRFIRDWLTRADTSFNLLRNPPSAWAPAAPCGREGWIGHVQERYRQPLWQICFCGVIAAVSRGHVGCR
jgi:hypothetical protein